MDEEQVKQLATEVATEAAKTAATEAAQAATAEQAATLKAFGERLDEGLSQVEAVQAAGGRSAEEVAADVQRLIDKAFAARDAARGEAEKDAAAKAAVAEKRAAFIAGRAGKLPEAYHGLIPETDDEGELEAGLKAAREKLAADAKAYGWKLPEVGADAPAKPQAADPNAADMTGSQKLKAAYAADNG